MAAEGGESLELFLNKATNPVNQDEDWDNILAFCDQVNKELEGPQIAVRLIAHKIQSPQEREALQALNALEACVKNCGKRFHQEIGKFRFLNELIKIVSPKYLGNHTTEKVKKRCVELLYGWSVGLNHEPKVLEAYQMLKKQGIVTEDPQQVELSFQKPAGDVQPERKAVFEDEEKSKLLARLLRSKHPDDLQAANRLIKNMVKQDAERMEKVSKRVHQIDTVSNNVKLLAEMLAHYQASTATESEKDVMKELYDTVEKERPNLFRLASDTDEKDSEGITAILQCNDEVLKVMTEYKRLVDGTPTENGSLITMEERKSGIVDGSGEGQKNKTDLDELGDLFHAAPSTQSVLQLASQPASSVPPLSLFSVPPPPQAAPVVFGATSVLTPGLTSTMTSTLQPAPQAALQAAPQPVPQPAPQPNLLDAQPLNPLSMNNNATLDQALLPTLISQPPPQPQTSTTNTGGPKAFQELDTLSQSLLQNSLDKNIIITPPVSVAPKLSMNEMKKAAETPKPVPSVPSNPVSTPPSSLHTSPAKPKSPGEIEPLTDVFVPLETIQPGSDEPLTPYDKNGLKMLMHVGRDRPRDDVLVIVVSIMSTNPQPIKTFSFLAAVPKMMRVKLQPPSATDLPGHNPILPPSAITQVMLIANPHKEKIRLKFKISYSVDSETRTDVGDVDTFPLV